MIIKLANTGLLHIGLAFSKDYRTAKIYSFSHIPFIKEDKAHSQYTEANVLKGIKPMIISSIKDYFVSQEEKPILSRV
ncbi:MAG: hypothetical protein R2741_03475 [Methanolobus sp.]